MATDVRTRFLHAAYTGDLKLFKSLGERLKTNGEGLQKTCERVKDPDDRTALHLAAAGGKTNVCKYLIEKLKLDVNLVDGRGETPLIHATANDHLETTLYLLKHGANAIASCNKGMTALHYAAEKGRKNLLQLLISKGAEIEAGSDYGTPLQRAAATGKKEALEILLERGANPNSAAALFLTPLLLSILAKSFECLELLVEAGADPNMVSSGVTPLGYAASEGEAEVVKFLLEAGADPDAVDSSGMTAIEHAALHGHHESVLALFPVTTRISSFPEWSFPGVMKHIRSEAARTQRELKREENFKLSKSRGEDAFKRKDYLDAVYWYTEAVFADPSDAAALSNRSICWARLNEGKRALSDAEACIRLKPDWPKAHYRKGVALKLLKNYSMASKAFSEALGLDPENKEIDKALRESLSAEFGIPVPENLRDLHI